ncbi:uncharacterized protein LOC126687600 [Mercurialis annua]|nr:uncharacterized protein LOC126687600 [Mercurialis annua]
MFFDWMSLCCMKNHLAVTLDTLPVADEVARVTTFPDDRALYRQASPRNFGAMISSLSLKSAQVGHLVTEAYGKLHDDWEAVCQQLKVEKERLVEAKEALEREKGLLKEKTQRVEELEKRTSDDAVRMEGLSGEVAALTKDRDDLKKDFEEQLCDITKRNSIAVDQLKDEVVQLRKQAEVHDEQLRSQLLARDEEWGVKLTDKEDKLYENLRQILRAGEKKVSDAARALGGENVDLTPFELDIDELIKIVPTLPPEEEEDDYLVSPEEDDRAPGA